MRVKSIKTINLITLTDKRNGLFGKAFAGSGAGSDGDIKYGLGGNINNFAGDKRISMTGQANNTNTQNFTDETPPTAGNSGAGTGSYQSVGINYNDQLGKKVDFSASYKFSNTNNSIFNQLDRDYIIPADSGQVYTESNKSPSLSYSHSLAIRINFVIDTYNSILFTPQVTLRGNNTSNNRAGLTTDGRQTLNETFNLMSASNNSLNLSSGLLYRRGFARKGRTLSLNLNSNALTGGGNNTLNGASTYYNNLSQNSIFDQQTRQTTINNTFTGSLIYIEPTGKNGMLKVECDYDLQSASTDKLTYSSAPVYALDTPLSSNYSSTISTSKTGISYQVRHERLEASAGLFCQQTFISENGVLPSLNTIRHPYFLFLPIITLKYNFSRERALQCSYTTSAITPPPSQLQNVLNNLDPLHLSTGNPNLAEPYIHNFMLNFNTIDKGGRRSFMVSINGSYIQHSITNSSIIPLNDTIIYRSIFLPRGAQLSVPINIDGSKSLSGSVSSAMPLTSLKCRLGLELTTFWSENPSIINGVVNQQENKSGSMIVNISSAISQNVDFILLASSNLVGNNNSANETVNSIYVSERLQTSMNLVILSNMVINASVVYTTNSGISAGYNRNPVVCNISIGRKIFKNKCGDIRVTVFDLFNDNTNIIHSVTTTYVQDQQSNMPQRYFLSTFSYKFRSFKKGNNLNDGHN